MNWAVSGIGATSAVGADADEMFAGLCAGRSGLRELSGISPKPYRGQYAYQIHDHPNGEDVPGRAGAFVADVVEQAATQAGLGSDLSEVPILIGSGLRESRTAELHWRDRHGLGELTADDLHFGIAMRERFGATDTHTVANACAASVYALALAADLLATDQADSVVVAGVDVLTESMSGVMERVHPVAPERMQPFDRNRAGVMMGEGAAAVVLTRDDRVDRAPLCRLRSVEVGCDAQHDTAPSPDGFAEVMRRAHSAAGVVPSDIDLVMLHGTATLLNDETEALATRSVFGIDAGVPLMTAIKSMTGHTGGASGVMGVVSAVLSMRDAVVPPVVGLDEPVEEAAGFRIVTGGAARREVAVAQVNALGFGGMNTVAVLEAANR
ncbi:3-oxoacyl-ACP synthase [Streptomyces sp. XM4193]|uniref:beta-ketoacyl synthase N-terminal-like domain-containing protein n=1 Tax=Streptomyces sp. XM4193 TaxID=2929782 RepID=UPI001FFBFF4E|nr:beta-ketoacyl synthase N-terminal-like domain-containing protein [Streptomyces sp. XM4193]MCK1795666.1 3-oxoacyl-ACP synthase [Streptomyces sp. XM4193]